MSAICENLKKFNYREGINPDIDKVVCLINTRFPDYLIAELFLSESVVSPNSIICATLFRIKDDIKSIVYINSNWDAAEVYEYLMNEKTCHSSIKKSDTLIHKSLIYLSNFGYYETRDGINIV